MASWKSIPLEISYKVVGWIAFASWSFGFYPQLILNFRRKSVVGLNFDFVLLNLTKHSSYMIYNVCLYFSPFIQKQYFDTYGDKEMLPVAANDVAFSIHAVIMTALMLFQIFIYEVSDDEVSPLYGMPALSLMVSSELTPQRGHQKVSRFATGLVIVVWSCAAICFFIALPTQSWLWLITIFNLIQVCMTCVKYIPQAKMNFIRKSTVGWSIGNILLDFGGGIANFLQMVIQSIDQNSWVNFYGNIGKTLISLISIVFDIIFMCQHYVLYPEKKASKYLEAGQEANEPLVDSSQEHV